MLGEEQGQIEINAQLKSAMNAYELCRFDRRIKMPAA